MATKTPKPPKAEHSTDVRAFHIKATLLSPCLGTAPENPDLYASYLIDKALKSHYAEAKSQNYKARVDTVRAGMIAQEIATLPGTKGAALLENSPDEAKKALEADGEGGNLVKGRTLFRRSQSPAMKGAVILLGYMIRGALKEMAETHTDIPMPASKVDKIVFVPQFEIPFMRGGAPVPTVDCEWSRPLRTKDPRTGVSRTCIATCSPSGPLLLTK